jgi:hypothetical protein
MSGLNTRAWVIFVRRISTAKRPSQTCLERREEEKGREGRRRGKMGKDT